MAELQPKYLSQLLLLQNVVINLPEIEDFFHFTCRGLEMLPGVQSSQYATSLLDVPGAEMGQGLGVVTFKLIRSGVYYGEIRLGVADFAEFLPYKPYIHNLSTVLGIILEERRQRAENELYLQQLKKRTEESDVLIQQLQKALSEIKTLRGIIPICMHCKGIRDDQGDWNKLEKYVTEHSDAQFSHGICDTCLKKYYSEFMNSE